MSAAAIEVSHLLHRLAHHQQVAAVLRGERALGQQHALVRMRRAVDAGTLEEADAADAQDVGDEAEACPVEGKQHRAARQLALRLLDAVKAAAVEINLGLQDAVGPEQRHEVGARRRRRGPTVTGCRLWPGPDASAHGIEAPSTASRGARPTRVPMPEVFDRR